MPPGFAGDDARSIKLIANEDDPPSIAPGLAAAGPGQPISGLASMNDLSPVFNSRIIKTYLEYLKDKHPLVNAESLLRYAGMTPFEVEDQAHWFSQRQVDRFQEKLLELTGDPDAAREAGRFAASARGLGAAKQVALGLTSLASGYRLIAKIYPLLSRGAEVKARRLGPTQVEILSRPIEGIPEKLYQCKNRMGFFEALGKVLTNRFPEVEHPECFHRGDKHCRYVIRWERTPSLRWKTIRNRTFLLGLPICLAAFAALPLAGGLAVSLVLAVLVAGLSSYSHVLARGELIRLIESQGDTAREHIEGISERYNNTLLIQEIGQATSRILDAEQLVKIIAEIMERRMGYSRGMILLKQGSEGPLACVAEYGSDGESNRNGDDFDLNLSSIPSLESWAWVADRPLTASGQEVFPLQASVAEEAEALGRRMGVQSLLAVPILYQEEVLGLVAVGNTDGNRLPTQSDLSLLRGVASQAAVSLINARSFRRLRESEEKYRNILETIEEAYFEVDLAGNFSFFNDSLCRISGYPRRELLGMNYRAYATPNTARRLYEVFHEVYATGQPAEASDYEMVTKGGSTRYIELSTSLVRGPSGQPAGFRGIVRDVTDRKQAEKEKAMLEVQLRQLQKLEAIGTLAGGIAHDFNNILAAIMGFSELAVMALPDGTEGKKNILEVLKASRRAKDLVQQILAFSRRTEAERKPVEPQPIVKEALKLLRASLPTTVEIRQDLQASGRFIAADPTQMHQLVMNLCTNAHHAMQEKGGILGISLRPFDLGAPEAAAFPDLKPGPYLSLEVSDTGVGMEPQVLERIFEPFFTTKGPREGTGMGLAVVHGIVKSHGGAIRVHSEPGRGTLFQVLLPRIREEKASRDAETPNALPYGMERILFVDDETTLSTLGKEMLETLGYRVEPCSGSLEALETFRARPEAFHLVITDKTMPQMTGFRLAEEIRRVRRDIPIILCTGYCESMDQQRAESLGINRTLMKPLSMESLAAAVREVLNETRPSHAAGV
jgi:PAS domain S-box-containing protein